MNTKQLRQKILDLAIRGKLVPQDPNDEPVNVLLEQIRVEKERLMKEGKIKRSKDNNIATNATDKSHYEQLPQGWSWCMVSNLARVSSSKRIYKDELSTSGIPFLKVADLINRLDGVNTFSTFIKDEAYLSLQENGNVPISGDILITSRGTLGACYIVKPRDEFYFQDGMISWLSFFNSKAIESEYRTFNLSQFPSHHSPNNIA